MHPEMPDITSSFSNPSLLMRTGFKFTISAHMMCFTEQRCTNYRHYLLLIILDLPVPMAAWCKSRTVFDLSNIGIADSNPARGMDVCPHFSVLCCPV
jgi:hypothetical protein